MLFLCFVAVEKPWGFIPPLIFVHKARLGFGFMVLPFLEHFDFSLHHSDM